eukprot:6477142-Amphidinium_carterae.1
MVCGMKSCRGLLTRVTSPAVVAEMPAFPHCLCASRPLGEKGCVTVLRSLALGGALQPQLHSSLLDHVSLYEERPEVRLAHQEEVVRKDCCMRLEVRSSLEPPLASAAAQEA